MTFGVAQSAPLVAAVLLPLVVVAAWRHGALAAATARALGALLVLLALAGLYVERPGPDGGACVVVAVDVSASVQDAGVESARAFLEPLLAALGPDDLVGTIAFGGTARVVVPPARHPSLARLLPPAERDAGVYRPEETDLARALVQASALCPADRQASIVLVTDGRETRGSLLAEAAGSPGRAPVFAVVPPPSTLPAANVRRLLVSTFVAAGAPAPLEAVVDNRTSTRRSAVLQMAVDDRPPLAVPLDLPPGTSVVALPFPTAEPGTALVEARLLLRAGEPQPPGMLAAAVTVTAPLHALVASERDTPIVATALARHGAQVDVVRPRALGAPGVVLDRYHVVVLDDVTRASFAAAGLAALADWVSAGGGLVVTGGPRTFGDPALVDSPLARLLPVELSSQTPEPQEREPIALEILIDRSNSMGAPAGPDATGDRMEYARRAALTVLAQLEPGDLVGAIAFDSAPHELGALEAAGVARAALAAKIRALVHGGGTDFRDALDIARQELAGVDRRVRHIILLTDGDTNRRTSDHFQVIDDLVRDDVTVSTIRIGDDTANLELLDAIARATGGEFHHVENPQALPQLMLSDARAFLETAIPGAPARLRVLDGGPMLAGFTPRDLPPVTQWATTRAKPDAVVHLAVETGTRRDPILASWEHGLGRVVAVPVDFQFGAARWAGSDGFGKLWTQLVRWTARRALPTDVHVEARPEGDTTLIALETGADTAEPPGLEIDGRTVPLVPIDARRAGARLPALAAGAHDGVVRIGSATTRATVRVPVASAGDAERRGGPPDRALLERVAARTGGRVDPAPAEVVAARAGVGRARTPLDGVLLALALAALVADVALRRLAR
jgi:Mg-chelatase subunit ChlD